jgi:preprotein translocase subunit YajC
MRLNQQTVNMVLVLLLVVAVLYISVGWTQDRQDAKQAERDQELQGAFQQGYDQGITAAVVTLFQQTDNCQPTTINVQDNVRQIVDTACLQQ